MSLAAELGERLRRTAGQPVPHAGDQERLAGETAAAVLMAVVDRREPGLILTQRPETMRRHPGQVAFPGGRVDPGDADAVAAALREAEEEIALPRDVPEVVGRLAPYHTVTGFAVTPVLAVIPPGLPLVPHDREVAALFELPLAFALAPGNRVRRTVEWQGAQRRYWEIEWQGRRIWGATAAMLVNLAARLAW